MFLLFLCQFKSYVQFSNELNIKNLSFGHHTNDVAETIVLNLFFQGKLESFLPNINFFDRKIILIRALIYCNNKEIL